MMNSIHFYIDATVQVLAGAQTEILLFVLAICMHTLVFSKHSVKLKPKKVSPPGSPRAQEARQQNFAPNAAVPLLKTAIREANFSDALGHLRNITAVASMPHQLTQGLVRLAIDEGKLASLLELLLSRGAAGSSLDAVAAECGRRADVTQLQSVATSGLLARLVAASPESTQIKLMRSVSSNMDLASSIFDTCASKQSGHFTALLEACISSRAYSRADRVMQQAIEADAVDISTYNTAIKGYLQNNQQQRAQAMVERMRSSGLSPDCFTLNELLDPIVNDSEKCWRLFTDMRSWGVKPNHVTCSILLKTIQARSSAAHVERVLDVVDTLEPGMDEVLMSSFIEACIRVDRADLLRKLLERQQNAKRTVMTTPHSYGSIVRACGYVGDVNGVWQTWREMRTRHVQLTSISIGCMVEALSSNGDPEAAYDMIRDVMADPATAPLLNSVIYGSVLKGFSHVKNASRMWAVYEQMLSEGVQLSITTYNTLVDACARNSEMNRIPKLLEAMQQQEIQPNVITYSAIVKGYCSDRRLDKAFELFEDMKRMKGSAPDEHTYNTLINGCACQGLFDKGMAVVADMEAAGVPPTNFTLSVLMKLCARARRQTEAFDLCQKLCAKYNLKPNIHVYNNLINACVLQRNITRALEVFNSLTKERVRPDSRTYTLLLQGCIACRAGDDAERLLRAATGLPQASGSFLQGAGKPHGGLPADCLSSTLAGLAEECGKEDVASQLLKELKHCREYAAMASKLQSRNR